MSHGVPNRNWSYPTAIKFGVGRISELADHAKSIGLTKPLLVTDKALASLPITAEALSVLDAAGLGRAVFSEVDPNPNERNMIDGIAAFLAGGHDGVICFGGGSALDLGKMIALMAHQRKDLSVWDLEDVDDWFTRADGDKIAPILAVPTTAGTGSEVGRAGVLTNSETHKKKIIFHPKLMPAITLCDPALTVGMPKFITAGTGMDALAHCLEAYCSPFYHPMSQGIALEGMRLVFENLALVYKDPTNLMARGHMMSAAAMGAVAFQKGLGAIHSLSHPVGAVYGTHHGTTNAVVMPMVLDYNRAAIEDRINAAAAYLGIKGGFDGFRAAIMALRAELSIPANLTAMGVKPEDLDMLTDMALEDPSCGGNPIEMTKQNTRALFDACM
ncbi:MAG: iron-containing alcohol dehydrogenase [Pseudotabrizicola sp.]|uniref:iron-containing alcohol dehydrogenase n=1 Tax=Pseudotabrizicola sp. TaxID=2939647 RepID=UPI0027231128|nr:iron-containing alcohol dehydrogenase [Pseudotabrizicola sp.]MDO8884700.1 iron-containing alcohol dehydrogenase [Pseudotabrizicola sp.]MDP2082550.1 iron-containing alcohol dehydrogenase [Pseudotabrizicola sp.]MDZ7573939.1 iron-containing alcohol dehydrogenase [Pseudotabrizicola sp.]